MIFQVSTQEINGVYVFYVGVTLENNVAPKVILASCHAKCLDYVSLKRYKNMPTKKVFCDGNCPLCNKEINLYKKLDTGAKFDWIDINTNQKLLDEYNLSFIDTMKIFHVIDGTGTLQKGVADGFLVIWRELKY